MSVNTLVNKMYTVYLDPGHGGRDPGAVGPTGLRESDMNLDVCKRIYRILTNLDPYEEDQYDVHMTRETDDYISLDNRVKLCNMADSDIFVSYHFNASSSPHTKSSWEIFTTKGQNNSDKLATFIGEAHAKQFPQQHQRSDWSDGDLDKEANFAVIRGANCPAVLVEGEFISTIHGEQLISDPNNRQKMAEAVAEGIIKYTRS